MADERCSECHGELTYCGEMTADGPSLDCKVCQLRARVRELEAELDNIAVEAGLGHSPRPGVVAAYTRALRQQIEAFGPAGGERGREITAAVLENIRALARAKGDADADA